MFQEKKAGKLIVIASASIFTMLLGTALAGHEGYTHAPTGFVSVTDFGIGFDAAESTDALQMAFDSGQNFFVPKMASNWITDELFLTQDNQTILFEEGVVVEALAEKFIDRNASLFFADRVENVRLEGYGATFRMRQADYVPGGHPTIDYPVAEWRHGIRLHSVNNFDIVGLTIEDTGGDGIYVDGISGVVDTSSQDVIIQDVVINNAYRNGISVIDAENLLIDNATIVNTSGTAPEAGIDFEPDLPMQKIVNITVRNSIIVNNGGDGIQWHLDNLDNGGLSTSTGLIENVTVYNNGEDGLEISPDPLPGWEFRNSLIINNDDNGFRVSSGPGTQTIEYSAVQGHDGGFFFGPDNFSGDVEAGIGTITDTALVFVNTTDPDNPLFMYLDPSTSTLISLGDSEGSFMGARGVAGDFDANASIDGFDFLQWQRGDSPNNGSAGDLAIWETYYGQVGTSFSALSASVGDVPEPSSAALLSLALGWLTAARRRRK